MVYIFGFSVYLELMVAFCLVYSYQPLHRLKNSLDPYANCCCNGVLRLETVCDLCGDEVYRELFGEPNSSPHEVRGAEQLPVFAATPSSVGVFE